MCLCHDTIATGSGTLFEWHKHISTNSASASDESGPRCRSERHHLSYCHRFKAMSCDERSSTVKDNNLFTNCLRSGHNIRNCKSPRYCRRYQKPHHTMLHVNIHRHYYMFVLVIVSNNASPSVQNNTLSMTCRVHVVASDSSKVKVRALLSFLIIIHFRTSGAGARSPSITF